ncbi:tudor domain-containing 6-like isoform X2 [Drosophila sulfurigaster albostrigata]|uniref:tudor domain-containing 6-like isoform X2 n=1 Tax=Drosophila sulfurigaster albostrigata TaxID=89887 RepID=UPI002D21DA24|nr:tudor domain-containing 6-like isoform X2 [Drosophila sulfurigaster albostrigata]
MHRFNNNRSSMSRLHNGRNSRGNSNVRTHGDAKDLKERTDETELSAESQMQNFMICVQSHAAIPEYALSEEVFNVDKPLEAVRLGAELPSKTLSQAHTVGNKLLLTITEVYSPFQFWFQEAEDADMLRQMSYEMYNLYSDSRGLSWNLALYFIKPGYICAAYHECIWKRARIMNVLSTNEVTVYCVDYGQCAQLSTKQLNFLHKRFMEQPAISMRGTLTDVYPLDYHWPADATLHFKRLVRGRDLYAIIKDTDLEERILFVNIFEKSDFQHSISEQLISARLAGFSRNYSDETIKENNGRRVRYIRERLPSFDMLEQQLFVVDSEKDEEMFDNIVYNSQFYKHFVAPKLANPFRYKLEEALANWLEKFKRRKELEMSSIS